MTYSQTTHRSHAWRIPREGSSRPVNVAARETRTFWEVVLSPDGKWLAYQADLPDFNTIWRVDLPPIR